MVMADIWLVVVVLASAKSTLTTPRIWGWEEITRHLSERPPLVQFEFRHDNVLMEFSLLP